MEIKVSNTADSFHTSKLTSVQCWWHCRIYHHRLIGIWKREHIEFWPRVMIHSIAEKFQISDSPRVLPGAPWLKLTRTITAAAIASIILKWNVTSRTKCTHSRVGDNLDLLNLLQNWWEKVLLWKIFSFLLLGCSTEKWMKIKRLFLLLYFTSMQLYIPHVWQECSPLSWFLGMEFNFKFIPL